jgi:hypothetical protein
MSYAIIQRCFYNNKLLFLVICQSRTNINEETYADKQMINFTCDLKLEVLNYRNNLMQPKFFQILK